MLLNLDTEFPEWAGRGYQIVGFAWHQGTSDKAPTTVADEYKFNLPDLISDVRAEFGKPNLPVRDRDHRDEQRGTGGHHRSIRRLPSG